ncbi:MAG: FKBP-type peptidyl-prolyl cis-trans isomerase [Isosphaeraceae bacterium]
MSSWHVKVVGAFLGLAVCGCEEPQDIVPVAPPGAVIPRPSPDSEPASAQGEMAAPGLESQSHALKPGEYTPATPTTKGQTKTTAHGVKYETLQEGAGPEAKPGQSIRVHYVGKLENGEVFDTTRSAGSPRLLTIGDKDQIKVWAEALPGMRVGEVRKMIVPPALGYGPKGRPPVVPPNSTLVFEVELIDIL